MKRSHWRRGVTEGWSEWNGKYRDTVRDFWRSTAGTLPDFATRTARTTPTASNDNNSWNCGAEGPTDDPAVLELRARQRRNFIATLMLSEGDPLLLGGDEFARTQHGNNNAYCQDNEPAWFDWNAAAQQSDLIDFTARLCRLREQHPVFHGRQFFHGKPAPNATRDDLDWYRPDGIEMTPQDWNESFARAVTMAMSGATGDDTRPDDPFLRDALDRDRVAVERARIRSSWKRARSVIAASRTQIGSPAGEVRTCGRDDRVAWADRAVSGADAGSGPDRTGLASARGTGRCRLK